MKAARRAHVGDRDDQRPQPRHDLVADRVLKATIPPSRSFVSSLAKASLAGRCGSRSALRKRAGLSVEKVRSSRQLLGHSRDDHRYLTITQSTMGRSTSATSARPGGDRDAGLGPRAAAGRRAGHRQELAVRAPGRGDQRHLALVVQGTAGTSEEHIKYSWNYALLLAEGPSHKALVPSPI